MERQGAVIDNSLPDECPLLLIVVKMVAAAWMPMLQQALALYAAVSVRCSGLALDPAFSILQQIHCSLADSLNRLLLLSPLPLMLWWI